MFTNKRRNSILSLTHTQKNSQSGKQIFFKKFECGVVSGIPSWEESNWSTEKGDEFLVFVVNSRNFWPFLIFILCQISPICSSKPTVCPSHSSFCLGRVPIWIVHMRFFAIWLLPKRKPSQNQREDGEWHQGFWALGSLLRGGLGCLCPVNKDHCPFQGCLFYIVLPPPSPCNSLTS